MEQLMDVFERRHPDLKNELIQLGSAGKSYRPRLLLERLGTSTITPALRNSLIAIARKVRTTTDDIQTGHSHRSAGFWLFEIEKWFDRGHGAGHGGL